MRATLPFDLRGLRDRAILLLGFAGLRRSEIVGLDCVPEETEDGRGFIEILADGALLPIDGKTGWRLVEIGRGSSERSCPVEALATWLCFARIAHGPVFRRVRAEMPASLPTGSPTAMSPGSSRARPSPRACAPLVEGERALAFAGHSLRAASPPRPKSTKPTSSASSGVPPPK